MTNTIRTVCLSAVTCAAFAAPALGQSKTPGKGPPPTKVYGTVVDSKGKPIAGVTVTLFPTGKADSVKSAPATGPDGAYDFGAVSVGSAFDLFFTSAKTDPACISRLYEAKDQHINTVLYQKGEPRPALVVLDTLQAVERAVFFAVSNDSVRTQVERWNAEGTFDILRGRMIDLLGKETSELQTNYLTQRQVSLSKDVGNLLLK